MTTDKKLKRVVRERMAKTGERYAAARRQTVDRAGGPGSDPSAAPIHPSLLPGYRRVGGPIAQLSALANALEARGAVAPHTGRPYSPALLFGLGGGVGGGYFMFQYAGTPTVAVIGLRVDWQDDVRFLSGVMTRLGVTPDVFQSGGRKAGEAALDAAMAAGRPVLAWTDRASLPYLFLPEALKKYMLVVVGVAGADAEHGTLLLDDRAASPWEVDRSAFTVARGLIATSKHRLLHVDVPPASLDLRVAVIEALRAGHRERTSPRIRNFGLPAFQKWADAVGSATDPKGWPATLAAGSDLAMVLEWAHQSIEAGTGGGGYRALYADFLDEASAIAGVHLGDAAAAYRELGKAWTALAAALLPDDVAPLGELRRLLERRDALLTSGPSELAALEEVARRLEKLVPSLAEAFAGREHDRLAFFRSLGERIEVIHRAEVDATAALHAAVGD